jgi:hypothetical protein
MNRFFLLTAALVAVASGVAQAHGIAGDRVFPATLTIDDPAVGDELSLPTFSTIHNGAAADGSAPGSREFDVGAEWDKTITESFGLAINLDYTHLFQDGGGEVGGWQDVVLTAKYQAYVNPEHEFMASVGVIRDLGGTGAAAVVNNGGIGSTTPTVYFGKGLGDLPIGDLRPLAVTGELGYQVSDQSSVSANQWNVGWSLQYSIPYLQQHVQDLGLPALVAGLTPLVEVNLVIPSGAGGGQTTGTIAPGLLYDADTWQFGVEALIPATRATNTGVGMIAQLHFFLDDIFPTTLGKPLL